MVRFYWLMVWFAIGFGVPEAYFLIKKQPQNTLSWTVWKTFQVHADADPAHWTFRHYVLLAFMVWLTAHFVWQVWR